MRQTVAYVCSALLVVIPAFAHADTVSEINITSAGVFSAKNLLVMQTAGTTVFVRATWGQAFVRLTVLTSGATTITKNHGEGAGVKDLQTGDRMDVDGTIQSGADSLMVTASAIRDSSLQTESKALSGKITAINASGLSFTLKNSTFASSTVQLSASTPIQKGARTVDFSELSVGDKVLSAPGAYDYPSNTLTASSLEIYQDPSVFKPRNFQGTLKSLSGTALPVTAVVTVGSTDYTVYLDANASVVNKAVKKISLVRFVVGDTVRFYGSIRKTNLTEVDAELIRDIAF